MRLKKLLAAFVALCALGLPSHAQQAVQPALKNYICTIPGTAYRGVCSYTLDGKLVYWIMQRWDDNVGYYAKEIVGYPSVLDKQREYNRWLIDNLDAHAADYPGVSKFVGRVVWGGRLDRFVISGPIDTTGELNSATIHIPFFIDGARLSKLWPNILVKCRFALPDAKLPSAEALCKMEPDDYDPAAWARTTPKEAAFGHIVDALVLAKLDLRRLQDLLRAVPGDLKGPQEIDPALLKKIAAAGGELREAVDSLQRECDGYEAWRAARRPRGEDPFGDELE